MSISLFSGPVHPNIVQPAFNAVEWVYTSTNTSQCNFKFICDVYVNSVFIARLQEYPDSNGRGVFRIERVLQDYISHNMVPPASTIDATLPGILDSNDNTSLKRYIEYTIELRESYDSSTDCSGQSTVGSVETTNGGYVFNAALSPEEYMYYDVLKYTAVSDTSLFLTNSPRRILLPLNDIFILSFMTTDDATSPTLYPDRAIFTAYDIHGVQQNIFTHTLLSTVPPSTIASKIKKIGFMPYLLGGIIGPNTKFFSVKLSDGSNILSESKEFEIDYRCNKFQTNRIYWLNRKGSFDSYHFNLVNKRTVDVNRSELDKSNNNTAITYLDRGRGVVDVESADTWLLNSDYMTENESKWIEEIFTSPEVYLLERKVVEFKVVLVQSLSNTLVLDLHSDFDSSLNNDIFNFDVGGTIDLDFTNFGWVSGSKPDGEQLVQSRKFSAEIVSIVAAYGTYTQVVTNVTSTAIFFPFTGIKGYGKLGVLKLRPVTVVDNSYEEKLKSSNKQISHSVRLKAANNKNIQNQ